MTMAYKSSVASVYKIFWFEAEENVKAVHPNKPCSTTAAERDTSGKGLKPTCIVTYYLTIPLYQEIDTPMKSIGGIIFVVVQPGKE